MIHRPSIIAPRCPTCGGFTREWLRLNRRRAGFASWLHGACGCCCRPYAGIQFNGVLSRCADIILDDVLVVRRAVNLDEINGDAIAIPRLDNPRDGWSCEWFSTIPNYVTVEYYPYITGTTTDCDASPIDTQSFALAISVGIAVGGDDVSRVVAQATLVDFTDQTQNRLFWNPISTSGVVPVFSDWSATYTVNNLNTFSIGSIGYDGSVDISFS